MICESHLWGLFDTGKMFQSFCKFFWIKFCLFFKRYVPLEKVATPVLKQIVPNAATEKNQECLRPSSIVQLFFCGNSSGKKAPTRRHFECSLKKWEVGYCGKLSGVR